MTLPEAERRARMHVLRRRVLFYDVHRWASSFLEALEVASAQRTAAGLGVATAAELRAVTEQMRRAEHLLLLLDYDGTLVPFAGVPELATPDEALIALLRGLAARPGTDVHIISGRPHETLDRWLGALPIGLHAEHGFWSRNSLGEWSSRPQPPVEWRERVRVILEHFAARTPGSLIEEKTASIAWHYRMADPDFGAFQANELRVHLTELLSNVPVELLTGDKVIEVGPHGLNKGTLIAR